MNFDAQLLVIYMPAQALAKAEEFTSMAGEQHVLISPSTEVKTLATTYLINLRYPGCDSWRFPDHVLSQRHLLLPYNWH